VANDPFIFVTVGSTDFDALISAIDNLAPSLQMRGIMQIGHGQYVPTNMPCFRFAPSLEPFYEQSSLVIAHGGLGTTMEVLRRGKPLVSVSNPDRYDNHQEDLLSHLAESRHLIWCRDLSQLARAIHAVRTEPLCRYQPPECRIHLVIDDFLHHNGMRS